MPREANTTLKDDLLVCLNCGGEYRMTMPTPMGIFAATVKAFSADHERCEPSEVGAKRMQATTPREWLASCDTGTSSETIWSVMTDYPVRRTDFPYDPSDFGRCYRLLEKFPDWKPRMPEVAARFPEWGPLVARWDEITAQYERDIRRPDGRAAGTYLIMFECRIAAMAAAARPENASYLAGLREELVPLTIRAADAAANPMRPAPKPQSRRRRRSE